LAVFNTQGARISLEENRRSVRHGHHSLQGIRKTLARRMIARA
jgi:hypothetical protein